MLTIIIIVLVIIGIVFFFSSIKKTAKTADNIVAAANVAATKELTVLTIQHNQVVEARLVALGIDLNQLPRNKNGIDYQQMFDDLVR